MADKVRVISERTEDNIEKRTFEISRAAAEESVFFKNYLAGLVWFVLIWFC
jgi:hypothetical protein